MADLVFPVAATFTFLVLAYFYGKKKKEEGLERAQSAPETISRLFLRKDSETESHWLHAEMKTGKKVCIASPWEVEETLARLERVGLSLSSEDRARLSRDRG